jgi:predicted nucleic acid-binding protein
MWRRKVLPDTNLFIDAAEGGAALFGRSYLEEIYLSAVVLKELRFGVRCQDLAGRRQLARPSRMSS